MRLLITRPKEDAETLAAILLERGHAPIVAPVMEVRLHAGAPVDLSGMQAILATSANGVRALINRTERRDIPLYAVGPQTAEAAREAGFAQVHSADGDAKALIERIKAQLDPAHGKLFHAAGSESAGRVQQNLQGAGFTVERNVLYDAVPVGELPANAAEALRSGALDGVMLFSPRSAKAFADLANAAELGDACKSLEAFCISSATAEGLKGLEFARVAVAGQPNQDAMLALLPAPLSNP